MSQRKGRIIYLRHSCDLIVHLGNSSHCPPALHCIVETWILCKPLCMCDSPSSWWKCCTMLDTRGTGIWFSLFQNAFLWRWRWLLCSHHPLIISFCTRPMWLIFQWGTIFSYHSRCVSERCHYFFCSLLRKCTWNSLHWALLISRPSCYSHLTRALRFSRTLL